MSYNRHAILRNSLRPLAENGVVRIRQAARICDTSSCRRCFVEALTVMPCVFQMYRYSPFDVVAMRGLCDNTSGQNQASSKILPFGKSTLSNSSLR